MDTIWILQRTKKNSSSANRANDFIESIIAFTRTFEQFCPLQTKRSHHYHQQIDKYSNVFAFQSKIISQSIAVAAIFCCCEYHLLVLIVEVLLGNFGLIQLFGLTPAMIVHLFICCKTTVWSLLSFALCIIMNSCKYQTKLAATKARPNKLNRFGYRFNF